MLKKGMTLSWNKEALERWKIVACREVSDPLGEEDSTLHDDGVSSWEYLKHSGQSTVC